MPTPSRNYDFGTLSREEIQRYVAYPDWQELRISLAGLSTEAKLQALDEWLEDHQYSRASQVQAGNYYNALKRGGQIKD